MADNNNEQAAQAAAAAAANDNVTDETPEIVVDETAAPAVEAVVEAPVVDAVVDTAAVVDTPPAIGSEKWIEEVATVEQLREYAAGTLKAEDEPKAASGDPKEVIAEPIPVVDEPKAAVDGPVTPALDFKFTPDADAETFKAEKDAYLALVDLDPGMTAILARQEAMIEAAYAATAAAPAVVTDESVAKHQAAFDTLVDFVQDPETQTFVPNTTGLITLLEGEYTNELPQVIIDLNSAPSKKYEGSTRFMEFIRDEFDLSNESMHTLDRFFENKGRFDVPAFVPEGINPQLAEAFWMAENREELVQKIDAAQFTIARDPEATAAEKETAASALKILNNQLAQIQSGLNANRSRAEAVTQQRSDAQRAVFNESVDRFVGTTRAIIDAIGTEAATGLEMMDETGAGITGTAFGSLIETAFSDNDAIAKYAQGKLEKHGVTGDWAAAKAVRDRLFEAEKEIVMLEKQGAHVRAIENAKKAKDLVVKELMALAKEAGGKINKKVVTGASKKLVEATSKAPRIPAARPKQQADASKASAAPIFEDMPLDEVRKYIRENNPYAMAARGDMSGFSG